MKLEILQENLSTALNQIHRVIPSKPQLPILSAILLEAKNNTITFSATDLYVGIKTTIPGKVEKPQSIAIPGRIFNSTISSLNPGKLTLALKDNTLTITSEKNRTTIQCLDATEFPEFPDIEGENHQLSISSLEEIQHLVGFSTSIDPTRPVLTSLLFKFSPEGLLVVGTDGFRLATLSLTAEKISQEAQYLFPAKAITEVSRITSLQNEGDVLLKISEKLKQAVMIAGNTQLYVRLIEGEYPPFQKIIPEEFNISMEIDGEEFENQLKRAQVFARESSNIIRLKLDKDELIITAMSASYGKQEGRMTVKVISGEQGEIAFNSKYLLDFMAAVKPDKVEFLMNESLTPAMMRPAKKTEYQYIIMPFRVNE